MRILYFDDYKLGVVKNGNIVDVSAAVDHHGILPPNTLMENVIAGFEVLRPKFEAIIAKSDGVPWASARLRAPLPRPHYMLCAFSNYLDRENSDRKELPNIDFFHKGSGVIGDGDTVTLEDLGEGATAYQPEPEFAYVIGKNARYVKEDLWLHELRRRLRSRAWCPRPTHNVHAQRHGNLGAHGPSPCHQGRIPRPSIHPGEAMVERRIAPRLQHVRHGPRGRQADRLAHAVH
jgi:hypothetical protein